MRRWPNYFAACLAIACVQPVFDVSVAPEEMAQVRLWASATFEGKRIKQRLKPALVVLTYRELK